MPFLNPLKCGFAIFKSGRGKINLMIKFRELKKNEIQKLIILMNKIISNIKYYPRKNLKIFMRDYSKNHLKEIYEHKDSIFLIADEGGQFVGFLFGWNEYGVFWIDWLGVEKHHRREHIATQLLKLLERRAKKMGCHKIFLDTSCTNFPAIKLYRKNGYRVEGKLKNHWLNWDYDLISKIISKRVSITKKSHVTDSLA
jgi:ribosomal protein S18 acetylase RimI-like enzyme